MPVSSIGWVDPRKMKGELLWPERFGPEEIERLKVDLGARAYEAQFQQRPSPAGGGTLKSHWWNYWHPQGLVVKPVRIKLPNGDIQERNSVELPESFDMVLQSWDMSFKDLKTSDFVVGQVHAIRGARRFIIDQMRGRMDFPATLAAVRELTGRHPQAHLKLVEDKANGPAVIQSLRDEISGLVEVNPQGGKVSRAAAASPELEAGNWYLPHPMIAPWVGNPERPTDGGFLAETSMFPYGANDDMCDAWSQSAIRIQKERSGGVFPMSESDVRIERPEISDKWPRMMGMHSDYKGLSVVWLVRQPDTGQHLVQAELATNVADPVEQAKMIKAKGAWIPGVIMCNDTQINRREMYAVAQKLAGNGLSTIDLTKVAESDILALRDAIQAKKVQVSAACRGFFDQYRMFRRDDNGKLPTENHGLIIALAAAWKERGKVIAISGPKPASGQRFGGSMGWATR